jgi:glutamine amidotransferase-like uncharacterized protein
MGVVSRLACVLFLLAGTMMAEETTVVVAQPIRVGVLSAASEPAENTSQGLYIKILNEAGMSARAISGQIVKDGALQAIDVFIIGGGSGTAFNKSLGPDGGANVEKFVKAGGGAVGSCAGGYSFVRGHNDALRYIEIANAECIDTENGRWARGGGEVEIAPEAEGLPRLKMHYMNGPLWKITDVPGFGRTVSLARYVTDVKKEKAPGGIMPGTPAILAGTFGDGRYVLFSAHPEFKKKLGNNPMVVDAVRWAARGKLAAEEKIEFRAVFPSMARTEGAQ